MSQIGENNLLGKTNVCVNQGFDIIQDSNIYIHIYIYIDRQTDRQTDR